MHIEARLRAQLAAIPTVVLEETALVQRLIAEELAYLASDEAIAAIARDPYWPKWDSPWWSMLLLWELGCAAKIPKRAVEAHVARIDRMLHFFPLRDEDYPAGTTVVDACCHCQLGSVDQVLAACGVDVDARLAWIRAWFERYQMPDGGLNCDEGAYLVTNEVPSSMVGTLPPFEAMLRRGSSLFVERAASAVSGRRLRLSSHTMYNDDERDSAEHWDEVTFPRFYMYDTLRGLGVLVRWATAENRTISRDAIITTIEKLCARFPDGIVRIERRAFLGHMDTRDPELPVDAPRRKARTRPLLEEVSRVGDPSPALTREWAATRKQLCALFDRGLIIR